MGLLDGKKGLIYGVRNERNIGWGCAKSLAREGATFALTFFGGREGGDVNKLAPVLGDGWHSSVWSNAEDHRSGAGKGAHQEP